jgi:hypothetical protein
LIRASDCVSGLTMMLSQTITEPEIPAREM